MLFLGYSEVAAQRSLGSRSKVARKSLESRWKVAGKSLESRWKVVSIVASQSCQAKVARKSLQKSLKSRSGLSRPPVSAEFLGISAPKSMGRHLRQAVGRAQDCMFARLCTQSCFYQEICRRLDEFCN